MRKVLVIDDDRNIATTLAVYLEDKGLEVLLARSASEGVQLFRREVPDIVILDMKLPDGSGLEVLKEIVATSPGTQVVMITAYATIETAVQAVKIGAFDYLPKPFVPGQLDLILERLKRFQSLELEVAALKGLFSDGGFLTRNKKMRRLLNTAKLAAESSATVLITGESGTGKGLLARLIHDWSPRTSGPFVTVDCAALQENLLESDLFGHVKGSFTGATHDKTGKLKLAAGGTAFLDEISEVPLPVQGKLLRFLQDREYERVGDPQPQTVDVRVIAATNRDLEEMVRHGDFREDLFFRLNVVELFLPPLRERPEDIPILSDFYLKRSARVNAKAVSGIATETMQLLQLYPWPGNVRELVNTIERGVILSQEPVLGIASLPPHIANYKISAGSAEPFENLAEMEKRHIQNVILHSPSLEEAAKRLGIDPATLWRKRKKYSLD
ncbi:MAG: sigma-54 dependent transcriptional regulator [Desulfobacterales bacterium]|nr:sigma-54 dependent transcriptional regulator [Desulfobacterales bacterium]